MNITLKKTTPRPLSLLNFGATFRLPSSAEDCLYMKIEPECGRTRYVSLKTGAIWYAPDVRAGGDDMPVIPVHVEAVATDIT